VCLSVSYISPIRYRPRELRENNHLSTRLKRHGEQSTLGLPTAPWNSDDEMLTRWDIEICITDIAGKISVCTFWNPSQPEMLIVVNFVLKIVLYTYMTVVKRSYAYLFQVWFLSTVSSRNIGYADEVSAVSAFSASLVWHRLSNSWNNKIYYMWLRLWPFELRNPIYILFSLAFYDFFQTQH
jgi:hypothetical protein